MNPTTASPTTSETPATTVKKERKPRRTFSVNLQAADGATLRITMKLKKDGTATTHAVHTVRDGKKKKSTRGATEQWANLDQAKVAADKLTAAALKIGWVRKERTAGFVAKPDAFTATSLPPATQEPPKTSKKK